MSIYQSTCERIICSPFVSGFTAILSAVYFIRYPSLSSVILTTLIVRGVDLLQKYLRKYDLERFRSFPRPVVEPEEEVEEEQAEEEQQEEEAEEQAEEEQEEKAKEEEYHDDANDEREEDEEYIPSHKSNPRRRTYNLRNRSD
jgi:hypothetical protein